MDDPDPSFIAPAWLTQDSSETVKFKRDTGVISQDRAPADLVFVSKGVGNPVDGTPYYYDGTAGTNVVTYILDSQLFDFSLPVSTILRCHVLTGVIY
jgi:hypothetical protein